MKEILKLNLVNQFMSQSVIEKLKDDYGTLRLVATQEFYITVDNSSVCSHNINIDSPTFYCMALNEAEAVGQMILSDWEYKHLKIKTITKH